MTLLSICCRLMRCLSPPRTASKEDGDAAAGVTQNPGDDLTRIKGIGVVAQDHLYKAGIRTYADLATGDPAVIIEAIGQRGTEARVADWIAQAEELRSGAKS